VYVEGVDGKRQMRVRKEGASNRVSERSSDVVMMCGLYSKVVVRGVEKGLL
jgi:hypothetical protein